MYTNNVNRITGFSGMDIDSMVEKLMNAESQKLYRLQQKRQLKSWKQEAYRGHISTVNSFKNTFFGSSAATNLKYSTAFRNYKTSVTKNGAESKAVSVSTVNNASSYSIQVAQMASKGSVSSSAGITKKIEGKLLLEDEKLAENMTRSDSMKFTLDGKSVTIKFDDNSIKNAGIDGIQTLDDIKSGTADESNEKLKTYINSQLKAAFGTEKNGDLKASMNINSSGRVEINSTSGHSLSITETTARNSSVTIDSIEYDEEGLTKSAINGKFQVEIGSKKYSVELNAEEGVTFAHIRDELNAALKKAKELDENGQEIEGGAEVDLSKSVVAGNTSAGTLFLKGTNKNENITITDADKLLFENGATKLLKTELLNDFGLKSGQNNQVDVNKSLEEIFGSSAEGFNIKINGKDFSVSAEAMATTSLSKFMSNINNSTAGVTISFDKTNNSFKLETKEMGADKSIKLEGSSLSKMNLAEGTYEGNDALFSVNGVWTSRTTNTIDLTDLKFTINETTIKDGQTLTEDDLKNLKDVSGKFDKVDISAKQDVDTTFDKIKNFIDEYNKMIMSLDGALVESRAKSGKYTYYDPLTDAQKEAMSDKEIEQWEEKAKTGLLKSDPYLRDFTSKLRQNMYESIDLGNGKKISLYDIGITTTSDMNKPGFLVIDEEKLKKAISERGSDIETLFTQSGTGIADRLDKTIDGLVGQDGTLRRIAGIADTLSAIQNSMSDELKDFDERIDTMKDYLYEKEMKYYEMFSRMESAMSNSDSQMSLLTSYQS